MAPGPSRTSLTSPPPRRVGIPNEVVSIIADYADQPTLVSIAGISRSIRQVCQKQLWSEVYLPLPSSDGILPTGEVHKRVKLHREMTTAERAACGAAYKAVIRNLLMAGPEQRWRAIRTIKMSTIPEALHDLISILGLASLNLQALELVAGMPGMEYHGRDYIDSRFRNVQSSITFPHLHTVRIGKGSIRGPEFIPYLCTIAPHLRTLDFALGDYTGTPIRSPLTPAFPALASKTKLQRLGACFTPLYTLVDSPNIDIDVPRPIMSLLRRSPGIRQLAVNTDDHEEPIGQVLDVICKYKGLNDLNWTEGIQAYRDSMASSSPRVGSFTALRRTVLDLHHWVDMFDSIPQLPNLEMLYFRPFFPQTTPIPFPSITTSQSPACRMIPPFHRGLINAPRFRMIHIEQEGLKCSDLEVFDHMDALEKNGGITGSVRSIKHGSSEVLHARLLLDYVEVSDQVGSAHRDDDGRTVTLPYTSCDRQGRVKVYEKLDEARWQNLTSYKGEVVPMEVLDRMMEIEGQVEGGWDRRGVEVGNAAWQVLLAWFDRSREEELAESESCI